MICPVLYLSNMFTAVRARTSTSRDIFVLFFRVRAAKKQACGTNMIRNVVFVVFGGILLKPTAGSVVLILKCTPLENVPWPCARIQEESYAISLRSTAATSAVNIA